MVPSIHEPLVAKYLTTVFGDLYVQNVYIQCVLQRWKGEGCLTFISMKGYILQAYRRIAWGNNPVTLLRVFRHTTVNVMAGDGSCRLQSNFPWDPGLEAALKRGRGVDLGREPPLQSVVQM